MKRVDNTSQKCNCYRVIGGDWDNPNLIISVSCDEECRSCSLLATCLGKKPKVEGTV